MRQKSFQLNDWAALDFYPVRPLTAEERIPLVLVLPGGGYLFLSPYEGEPVALRCNTKQLHAAVLRYSTAPVRPITVEDLLAEVQAALDCLAGLAADYQIDQARISVLGFSAGGHLAAYCSSRLADRFHKAILVYPATSFEGQPQAEAEANFHRMLARVGFPAAAEGRIRQNFIDLFAQDPTAEVSARTRPTFIFQTDEDHTVDPLGTLRYCQALRTSRVPFELFYCQKGAHGLGLADETSGHAQCRHQAAWFDLAMEWLKDQDAVS